MAEAAQRLGEASARVVKLAGAVSRARHRQRLLPRYAFRQAAAHFMISGGASLADYRASARCAPAPGDSP